MPTFAVTTAHGPNWRAGLGPRDQPQWDAHADFADALVDAGVIVVGGPIDGDDDDIALLLVRADDEQHVHASFAADPWLANGVFRLKSVRPWTIWLDGVGVTAD